MVWKLSETVAEFKFTYLIKEKSTSGRANFHNSRVVLNKRLSLLGLTDVARRLRNNKNLKACRFNPFIGWQDKIFRTKFQGGTDMHKTNILFKSVFLLTIFLFSGLNFQAQENSKKQLPDIKPVMWEQVNISERDLFLGPGGKQWLPDLSRITFIGEEKAGHNKKYRIKDGSGRIWVAKLGREAQPETVSVRLLWALGYKTEINYLAPEITIPGKGTFENVRLEARPDYIERLDEWKWKDNPFTGTNEFQGLKIMMVFLNNWDIVDIQNMILQVNGQSGTEIHYVISDLGATFGRLGNNNLPVIYRLGRSTSNPRHYLNSKLISNVENGRVKLSYKGKNRDLFDNITVEQARWLVNLLNQLTDKQIEAAFRAANYSEADRKILSQAVRNRSKELNEAVK